MTSSTSSKFDVAIVGYGPVGALSALLLAAADLRVVILERSVEPLELPRAVGLDGEAVRMFQRIGYGSTIADLLQGPREKEEIHFTNSKSLNPSGKALTIAAWIKPDAKDGTILVRGAASIGFALILTDSKPRLLLRATGTPDDAGSTTARGNEWTQLAGV